MISAMRLDPGETRLDHGGLVRYEPGWLAVEEADALKAAADDLDSLAARGYHNEALDQLVVEVLLGVR